MENISWFVERVNKSAHSHHVTYERKVVMHPLIIKSHNVEPYISHTSLLYCMYFVFHNFEFFFSIWVCGALSSSEQNFSTTRVREWTKKDATDTDGRPKSGTWKKQFFLISFPNEMLVAWVPRMFESTVL